MRFLADMSADNTSPPSDSMSKPVVNSDATRATSAPSLSILLNATMTGFPAASQPQGVARLILDTIIRRNHKHNNVCGIGTPLAHLTESGVPGSVDEGDRLAIVSFYLVGSNVLRDATSLTADNVCLSNCISGGVFP